MPHEDDNSLLVHPDHVVMLPHVDVCPRCEVEITLEINANRSEGFDESTIRTISENSRALKFEHYGFEEG